MEVVNSEQVEEPKIELEDHIILRLPPLQAAAVRNAMKQLKPKKFRKFLSIALNNDKKDIRTGTVKVKKECLHARLVDLPCVAETSKTIDKTHLFKTADVSQMLICQVEEFNLCDELPPKLNGEVMKLRPCYPHGIAPSMKNVKKERFRKVMRNSVNLEKVAQIEKEVLWLLRADNEAVSTRFELIDDEPVQKTVNEWTIFGEVISDSESDQDLKSSSSITSSSDLNKENIKPLSQFNETAGYFNYL